MLTWQATSLGWFLGTGRTNMSSVELWYHKVSGNFLKSLNASRRPIQLRKLEKDLRMRPSLMTCLRRRWSLSVTGFWRDTTPRNCPICNNMGAHIPPITLWTAGSMIPMGPWRRTSRRQNLMKPLVDPRDLLAEEAALHNYHLKSTNLSTTRNWNVPCQNRSSTSITKPVTAMIQTHLEMMGQGILGIYVVNQNVIIELLTIILVWLKIPQIPI